MCFTDALSLFLCQSCRDDRHRIDFHRVASAGEVIDLCVQTKKDRAISFELTHALSDLVSEISCIDIREDEGVGITRDIGAGLLLLADTRGNSSIELQLAVDRDIGVLSLCLLGCILDLCYRCILG